MDDKEIYRRYREYCERNRRCWRNSEAARGPSGAESEELPPVLHFLVGNDHRINKRERDGLVAERLRSHPEEAAAVFRNDRRFPTALHRAAACREEFPPELLRELMDAFPGALRIRNRGLGELPLHLSIAVGAPFENVVLLAEGDPSALAVKTRYGRLPVHLWAEHRRRSSSEEAVGFRDGLRTMLDKFPDGAVITDGCGQRTVLDMLEWMYLRDLEQDSGYEQKGVEWDTIMIILSTAHKRQKIRCSQLNEGDGSFFPVHALIELERADPIDLVARCYQNIYWGTYIDLAKLWTKLQIAVKDGNADDFKASVEQLPISSRQKSYVLIAYGMGRNQLLEDMIQRHPEELRKRDEGGNLPLHLAARSSRMTSNIIDLLLRKNPSAAATPDGSGRLPLHIASASGMAWGGGVQSILDAAPEVLREHDGVSHLYSFMMAAVGEYNTLDTVYHLLREAPEMVIPLPGLDQEVEWRTAKNCCTLWCKCFMGLY